jgi:spore maturation protein CgeB
MNIIYVGPLQHGRTCTQRLMAMQRLGHQIFPVDTRPPWVEDMERRFLYRAWMRMRGPLDLVSANRTVLEAASSGEYDALWLDKAVSISADTLRRVRAACSRLVIVGYSPDDMGNRLLQSVEFRRGLRYYDVFFTTKSFGVTELTDLGCPRVVFVHNTFDTEVHRPLPVTSQDRARLGGPVGFIGDYEEPRMRTMHFLAENGIPVRVWGPNWQRWKMKGHPNLHLEGRPVWSGDYTKAICCFDIMLGFLRKVSRDQQTQRSVQIPACKVFLLAERTDEHRDLFAEGHEAEFFSTDQECLEKVHYYLAHPSERERIAAAGLSRCHRSGYSSREQLTLLLQDVARIAHERSSV